MIKAFVRITGKLNKEDVETSANFFQTKTQLTNKTMFGRVMTNTHTTRLTM